MTGELMRAHMRFIGGVASGWVVCRAVVAMAIAALGVLYVMAGTVRAQALPDEQHGAVLAGFLSTWAGGDAERLAAHFAPEAVVSWSAGWTHATGPLQVRAWAQSLLQEKGSLTGQLERASGSRASWRLSRRIPADIRLGLPAQDSIVEVELRDGKIIELSQWADPVSRERYLRALRAVTAQPTRAAAEPEGAEVSVPPRAGVAGRATWLIAAVGCVVAALVAVAGRRGV